ncbi:hypothetical protein Taro_019834 [Colocasia esculenta]|uniref:CCHC-type domain-containing protein n=1 Tax=Colocasia esculenta TaxID=4460 RepID=A0A843V0K1_COLES|nr:hypothetical protein [Colocasia esculenta]
MSPENNSSPPRVARRFRGSDRMSYRDAPYRRDRSSYRQDNLCKNCKRPGHYARDCPNVAVCNNCGLPGHIAAECTEKTVCWNCKEPGHMASQCTNEPICHVCSKTGHLARDCPSSGSSLFDTRLCNNCYKPGHIAADCTNEKACNNCRKTGHLARDCPNEPVCNLCNVSGHMAWQCSKSSLASEIRGPSRDIICRMCNQPGHISRDCIGIMICNNCGGRGHLAYECPSVRMFDRAFGLRRHVIRYSLPDAIRVAFNIFFFTNGNRAMMERFSVDGFGRRICWTLLRPAIVRPPYLWELIGRPPWRAPSKDFVRVWPRTKGKRILSPGVWDLGAPPMTERSDATCCPFVLPSKRHTLVTIF